ncbi:MAG: glycoside hydrolase family 15 protein [Burkholderiaceae bacterium]
MSQAIEDYALIGNTRTAALVARNGSIDWMCAPRFDSPAMFSALLGDEENGRWRIAPRGRIAKTTRRYRDRTMVLETDFECEGGVVRVVDSMPLWPGRCDVVRVVQGLSGRVALDMSLIVRFEYGIVTPWVTRIDGGYRFVAGPDALTLRTYVNMQSEAFHTSAQFEVGENEMVPFVLSFHASHEPSPLPIDAFAATAETERWWREWCADNSYDGPWQGPVERSLLTLKALTYQPTGGITAAPTTSLPEQIGSTRNWDYRYCWLRDSTFTLYALLMCGFRSEAQAWREWLVRAVAGRAEDLQILYDITGGRRLDEWTVDGLAGYEGSRPVRVGNAAARQFQLDVYGEVMDTLHVARASGLAPSSHAWDLQRVLLDFLESNWDRPDEGIWEIRGERRHFTHSRVMTWVAVDRGIKAVERFKLEGPVDRWRDLRSRIHREVCERGVDSDTNGFVQAYGSKELDASLLMIPLVGFLPADDPRVLATIEGVERELMEGGFVYRYRPAREFDGLPEREGAFLPCTFWLADCYAMTGRREQARQIFERLCGLANDVGLLSEEYDVASGRLVGNFPQAFTHVALVNTALNLPADHGPGERRRSGEGDPGEQPPAHANRAEGNAHRRAVEERNERGRDERWRDRGGRG